MGYDTQYSCLNQPRLLLLSVEHSIDLMQAMKLNELRGCHKMARSVTNRSPDRQHTRGILESSSETIVIQVNPRIGDIVDSYLEHRSRDVDTLLDALDKGEFDQIRHLAHDLIGTGGSFGFEDMSLIGRCLENAALNKETKEIKLLVEDLAEYLSNVKVVY